MKKGPIHIDIKANEREFVAQFVEHFDPRCLTFRGKGRTPEQALQDLKCHTMQAMMKSTKGVMR